MLEYETSYKFGEIRNYATAHTHTRAALEFIWIEKLFRHCVKGSSKELPKYFNGEKSSCMRMNEAVCVQSKKLLSLSDY